MFGPRRRRPVLGTALIIGGSRAAARREVDKQSAAAAQRSEDVDKQVANRKQEEEEQEAKIQKAVDEALKKTGAGALPSPISGGGSVGGGGDDRPVKGKGKAVAGGGIDGGGAEGVGRIEEPKPVCLASGKSTEGGRGSFLNVLPMGSETPQNSPIMPAASRDPFAGERVDMQFCFKCGLKCEAGDAFCRRCGVGLG